MVDEKKFEHAGARVDHLGGPGAHNHAIRTDRRTGRLQLRHLFDLDDADAAGSIDADARVVAVIGNRIPCSIAA
jgi:hypothetical protein